MAAGNGYARAFRRMVELKADAFAQNSNGQTALHKLATTYSSTSAVIDLAKYMLRDLQFDPKLPNKVHTTPLRLNSMSVMALQSGQTALQQCIEENSNNQKVAAALLSSCFRDADFTAFSYREPCPPTLLPSLMNLVGVSS